MPGYPLRAVVGLGNPGADYEHTRHNAGFWFVQRLAEAMGERFRAERRFRAAFARGRLGETELMLLKPATFMNSSGESIQPFMAYYKLKAPEILVVHDDMDLPAGVARFKMAGGHGGHNGLRSIHQHIGNNYARLRIGIGHPGDRNEVLNYVLGRPGKAETSAIDTALDAALDAFNVLLTSGWDKATQQLHTHHDN